MRGGCEWELGYSITHVPMYIAFIFPLPRGHNCRPFGSSTTAGSPRKYPSCRSCESSVVVVESKSFQYQQGTHIGENLRFTMYICIYVYMYICNGGIINGQQLYNNRSGYTTATRTPSLEMMGTVVVILKWLCFSEG